MNRTQSVSRHSRSSVLVIAFLVNGWCMLVTAPLLAQKLVSQWRYTLRAPDASWTQTDFDDSGWSEGSGGFGTRGTPGGRVGTQWNTPSIWLRKTFELDSVPDKPALLIHHDEDAEVFINGRSVASFDGYSKQYEVHPLSDEARKSLVAGRNVLAVHCRQTRGGQYIDVHVIDAANSEQSMTAVIPPKAVAAGNPDRSAEPDQFHLLTSWGEKVTPENAWREYPRPQMKRDRWLCLNGLWEFALRRRQRTVERRPGRERRVRSSAPGPAPATDRVASQYPGTVQPRNTTVRCRPKRSPTAGHVVSPHLQGPERVGRAAHPACTSRPWTGTPWCCSTARKSATTKAGTCRLRAT